MSEPAPSLTVPLGVLRRFGPQIAIAVTVLVGVTIAFMFLSHQFAQIILDSLRHNRDLLEAIVRAHPLLSILGYVGVYAIAVGLSLPVAMWMTLAGGLLFGALFGGMAAASGCTLGSAVVFMICRTAAGDILRRRAGPTIARIEDDVLRDAFWYVMVLRLLPITPLWLANAALGFIEIPFRTFFIATFAGILPVSFIYAGLGSGFGKVLARGGHIDLHQAMTPPVILALASLAVLSVAPIVVRHFRRTRD